MCDAGDDDGNDGSVTIVLLVVVATGVGIGDVVGKISLSGDEPLLASMSSGDVFCPFPVVMIVVTDAVMSYFNMEGACNQLFSES